MKLPKWLRLRLRLWAIYNELGYCPWRKPRRPRKAREQRSGVYIGTREAIPFLNDDAKRTFSHLLLRPGYMMRDYILRGQHERYLAPFTALLVFYSVFTLIVAVVQPSVPRDSLGDGLADGLSGISIEADSTATRGVASEKIRAMVFTIRDAVMLTRLDLHPDLVDTPWKASLAAIEGDLRSKGIPLFLGSFLLLWFSMAILLRKKGIRSSGAAAASAYVLCQYCIFMFLALLLSWGRSFDLGILLVGLLLVIDYRQLLGLSLKDSIKLTIKTGLWYLLLLVLFSLLLSAVLILYAYLRVW